MSSVVLATAGYDHTIRFWEATSGICYRTLQYGESQVNKLEITADKTHIAAAGNSQIRIFDVNSNELQPINTLEGHTGNVTAVGFQKDGKWLYSGARHVAHFNLELVFWLSTCASLHAACGGLKGTHGTCVSTQEGERGCHLRPCITSKHCRTGAPCSDAGTNCIAFL